MIKIEKINQDYNNNIKKNKVEEEHAFEWVDCVVVSSLIKNNKTYLEVYSDSVVEKITFSMSAHLRKGDILKVLVFAGEEVKERPEYNSEKKMWVRRSDQIYLIKRDLKEHELAVEIKILDSDGAILCCYDSYYKETTTSHP